jgi:hypothetical protein
VAAQAEAVGSGQCLQGIDQHRGIDHHHQRSVRLSARASRMLALDRQGGQGVQQLGVVGASLVSVVLRHRSRQSPAGSHR